MQDRVALRKRPVDLVLVLYFAYYWFTVMITDLHNFASSLAGVPVDALVGRMFWPPALLSRIYLSWARNVDPVLYQNPVFFQAMEWFNLLILMPFSLYAIYVFVRGRGAIRKAAFITQAFTFYSVVLCTAAALWGDNPSKEPASFLLVYLPFLVFPGIVVGRLWEEDPFSEAVCWERRRRHLVLFVLGLVTIVVTGFAAIRWLVLNRPF